MTPRLRVRRGPGTYFRLRELLSGIAAVAAFSGCEIPTDPPEIENRWVVPADETRFGVGELLPGDVTLTDDESAFLVDFDPIAFSATLGDLCPACATADGLTVPKPPFVGAFASTLSFPPEVTAIEVIGGQVQLELFNGFDFDPIRPAAGSFGFMELTISDEADGDELGTVVIDGQDQAFTPGATLVTSVDIGGATVEGAIEATVLLDSPTGDPVTIDASSSIAVTATPLEVRVASVEIDVANQAVDFDPVDLDIEDVDSTVVNRIVSGGFVLHVTNPFGVSSDFNLTISGPTISTIQKSASLDASPESMVVLAFTGDEIRSFLGQPNVVLAGGAVVDAGAGNIVVSPGQELVLTADLDMTLLIGG